MLEPFGVLVLPIVVPFYLVIESLCSTPLLRGGERVGYSVDRGPHTTTTVQPTILPPAPSGVASLQGGLNVISNQTVAYRQHTYTKLKLT